MIPIAHAQEATAAAQCLVDRINDVFLFPLIALLSAVAFVVFLYGAFEYVQNSASQEGRQTGQRHLLYGIIGLLVMFSAFTILQIAAGTFGLSATAGPSPCTYAPSTSLRPQARPEGPQGLTDVDTSFGGLTGEGLDRSPGSGSAEADESPTFGSAPGTTESPTLDSLPAVDQSPTCEPGTILLNGRCVVPSTDTVDPSPREVIAAEFQPRIDQEIAAGEYTTVLDWYETDIQIDQQTRVRLIQETWPDQCDSLNGEFRELDTGSGGMYICVQ